MFANRARGRPVGFLARKAVDLAARYLRTARAGVGFNPYQGAMNAGGKLRCDLLHDPGSAVRALELVRQSRPQDLAHVIDVADRARRGEVTILSHVAGPDASEAWDMDFVSGARWPAKFHAAYLYSELLDFARPSDVKVPWDLSRMQVLPSLAVAYLLTGDPGYVDAAAARFASWDRACPVGFGITWAI